MDRWLSESTRAWLYRVASATVPLLVAYGVVADSTAALWLGLAGALLGTGATTLAAVHTPARRDGDREVRG